MTEFWAIKWIGYIVASYVVVGVVVVALTLWIVVTYEARKRELARLERQGLKRATKND